MSEETAVYDRLMSGTVGGILTFLEVKIKNHELPENIGKPLITATRRMIEVDADVASTPVDQLDPDHLVIRFKNTNGAGLQDGSAQAYASRFRRARIMYIDWLNGNSNWNAGTQRGLSTSRPGKASNSQGGRSTQPAEHPTTTPQTTASGEPTHGMAGAKVDKALSQSDGRGQPRASQPAMFEYPVPCDSGETAVLRLPVRFTTSDAMRMKAIIDALAREPQPASTSA